jgi:serine/threonine protein kinase
MKQIYLPGGEWNYDPSKLLGGGGFADVFVGYAQDEETVAVKRLKISAEKAAHRELRMADTLMNRSLEHVLPVLDAGMDAETEAYFIVSPKAERSLQDAINDVGMFTEEETVDILLQISLGLDEVSDIVHRDLKPSNVLFHENAWKVADFGIARFVEESTSLNTVREALTPAYASPEQLEGRRATSAADIYALGCISHTLLTGSPPFTGPGFAFQHLNENPPTLDEVYPRLRMLISMMLRKVDKARPSRLRVIKVLQELNIYENVSAPSEGLEKLALVGARDAERLALEESQRLADDKRYEERKLLFEVALKSHSELIDTLFNSITDNAPSASLGHRRVGSALDNVPSLELGSATIYSELISTDEPFDENLFNAPQWDVIAGSVLAVFQARPYPCEWSANLWYTNLGKSNFFRWYEVTYCKSLGSVLPEASEFMPFALRDLREANLAVGKGISGIMIAVQPIPVDDEDMLSFCQRWAGTFADAYDGNLRCPSLPPPD